ncbi:uncharacterized protein LOC126674408 [Mercurialis annua]|uniref:uncharacterized protein LOC126674408 n=1 Tax=Mercurialis annua TaxID=3986 RepID=UPI00215F243A|nr:uncharacterized protein LOC126674408 [Mercurialis annua]
MERIQKLGALLLALLVGSYGSSAMILCLTTTVAAPSLLRSKFAGWWITLLKLSATPFFPIQVCEVSMKFLLAGVLLPLLCLRSTLMGRFGLQRIKLLQVALLRITTAIGFLGSADILVIAQLSRLNFGELWMV